MTQGAPPEAREDVSYSRGFWAGLLKRAGRGSVVFGRGRWELTARNGTRSIDCGDVTAVQVRRGLFWSTLEVTAGSSCEAFPGLSHAAAAHLRGVFTVSSFGARVAEALARWEEIKARQRYINHFAWSEWKTQKQTLREAIRGADLQWSPPPERERIAAFIKTFDELEATVARLNQEHVERELRECKELLDSAEANPLTRMQRVAVVTDEDNTLVVAGAGTGKTSVVVAKVAYLLKRLGVPPEEVLLLAYNSAAAAEMQKRVFAKVGVELSVSTFHAFGLEIIGLAEGAKPSLSRLTGEGRTAAFIEGIVSNMLAEPSWRDVILPYLISGLKPCREPEEFKTKHEYVGYLKGADIITFLGEQVQSHEECTIANWLFVNGIEYEYERKYEHPVADAEHRQYTPDFHLVESGIYVEHFGIDRDGQTAPWVPRDKYHAGMEWKRRTHLKYGTRLVETFSYDRKEGLLTERLGERLAKEGVEAKPMDVKELGEMMKSTGAYTRLAKLLATFLQHFKEGQRTLAQLRASTSAGKGQRAQSFLTVFEGVHSAYEETLRAEAAIDFQDMIRLATDHVQSGRIGSTYKYVIVDEFQDTSQSRARLLCALLDKVPDRRLMCVGDDWQSIYRFAGSDIAHMTRFPQLFGHTATVPLDESFRFGKRLLQASALFIQKNPAQLRKTLRSSHDEGKPPVVVVAKSKNVTSDNEKATCASADDLQTVLDQIQREHVGSAKASVFLLGRYNFMLREADFRSLATSFPRLALDFRTVHRSKGLEADYVVVLEATSGRFGFPSGVDDDPLLSMVLAEPDALEHAEERRLFYVALTRARRRVYILTRETQQSPFVEELCRSEYSTLVESPANMAQRVPCPECGGTLTLRKNQSGEPFWGCVDYPYCSEIAKVCTVCHRGAIWWDGQVNRCSEKNCRGLGDVCPRCEKGVLVLKYNGQDGSDFLGCSGWIKGGGGCDYTCGVEANSYRNANRRRTAWRR